MRKMTLDKASKDNEIHIAEKIAIDYMDSTFKIYSCSRVNNDKYLEMAFIDPTAIPNCVPVSKIFPRVQETK